MFAHNESRSIIMALRVLIKVLLVLPFPRSLCLWLVFLKYVSVMSWLSGSSLSFSLFCHDFFWMVNQSIFLYLYIHPSSLFIFSVPWIIFFLPDIWIYMPCLFRIYIHVSGGIFYVYSWLGLMRIRFSGLLIESLLKFSIHAPLVSIWISLHEGRFSVNWSVTLS